MSQAYDDYVNFDDGNIDWDYVFEEGDDVECQPHDTEEESVNAVVEDDCPNANIPVVSPRRSRIFTMYQCPMCEIIQVFEWIPWTCEKYTWSEFERYEWSSNLCGFTHCTL